MRAACIVIVAAIAACTPSTGTVAEALEAPGDGGIQDPADAPPDPADAPPDPADAELDPADAELDPPPSPDAPPPPPPSWNNPTCPQGQLPTGFGSVQCMQCMYMGGDSSEQHAAQLCLAAAQNCVGHIGGDATTMAKACCDRIGREHAVVWGIYWSVGLCQGYVTLAQ